MSAPAVLHELEQMHEALQPGDPFPSRRELLERLGAPERIVRDALAEFERGGKIIRRVGRGGTIVAGIELNGGPVADGAVGREGSRLSAAMLSRTLVVIAEPDGAIFDSAIQLLARHPKASELAVNCRLMSHQDAASFEWPSSMGRPLGFLLLRHHFGPLARKLQGQGHRVVLLGSPLPGGGGAGVPNVYGDRAEGHLLVARHLWQLGHRRFLTHAHGPEFMNAVRESGMAAQFESCDDAKADIWPKNLHLVREYFSRPDAPTALLAWNDEYAIQFLSLLNRAGLRVPEDVSLVGYDNLPQSALMHPSITTVDSAIERQVTTALRLLTQVEAPPSHHSVLVMPTLVPRESSAAPQS